jgi:hypothetical protein
MVEVTSRFMEHLGQRTASVAMAAGRDTATLDDLIHVLIDLDMVKDLAQVETMDLIQFDRLEEECVFPIPGGAQRVLVDGPEGAENAVEVRGAPNWLPTVSKDALDRAKEKKEIHH